MKKAIVLSMLPYLFTTAAYAGEFEEGCQKAATEVLCQGHRDCQMGAIMDGSKKGNDSAKGGYEECTEFAKFAKAQGISLDAKRAIKRIKAKIDNLNQELAKDFPFIKITADFERLALEDIYENARYMDHYKTKDRQRSSIVGLSSSETSTEFDNRYLNPIKTALYNVGSDEEGKEALKSKIKEIRFGFYSHGRTGWLPEVKLVDGVLIVPGVAPLDQTGYAASVQSFIEKEL